MRSPAIDQAVGSRSVVSTTFPDNYESGPDDTQSACFVGAAEVQPSPIWENRAPSSTVTSPRTTARIVDMNLGSVLAGWSNTAGYAKRITHPKQPLADGQVSQLLQRRNGYKRVQAYQRGGLGLHRPCMTKWICRQCPRVFERLCFLIDLYLDALSYRKGHERDR